MLTSVMYMTLYVSDQDQALDFYTNVLGFEKRIDAAGPEGRSSPSPFPTARSRSS